MSVIRWGIIGCGDVTEVKSGPALQKARGSARIFRDGAQRGMVPVADVLAEGEIDQRIGPRWQHAQKSFLLFSIRSCFTWKALSVFFRKKVTRK